MVNNIESKPKIIFVVTEDWAVLSHRLPMARAAKDLGLDVLIATQVNQHGDEIIGQGFRLAHIPFSRENMNPIFELRTVFGLIWLFWKERPDIVHNISIKPILDGTFASLLSPVKKVFNTFTGMGALYIGDGGFFRRLISKIIVLLSGSRKVVSIVQNMDDFNLLLDFFGGDSRRLHIVRGSGIDTDRYLYTDEPEGPPVVTMVSRILSDKGVREFIQAAGIVRTQRPDIRFILAGSPDQKNPQCIPEESLHRLNSDKAVELPGHVDDASRLWLETHIAVLPSYREGLPMSLLEASASGRPMVTTDAPGCRELVRDGVNGLLVPVGDGAGLAKAILRLADNPDERKRMGRIARSIVVSEFSAQAVGGEMQSLYKTAIH